MRQKEDPRTSTVAAGRRGDKLEKHTRYTAVWGQFMFTDNESKRINRTSGHHLTIAVQYLPTGMTEVRERAKFRPKILYLKRKCKTF